MNPVNPHEVLDRARQLLGAGQLNEAEQLLRSLNRAYPGNADLLHNIGVLCSRQGKLQDAEQFIRDAISINGNAALLHSHLGEVLGGQGRLPESMESYRRAAELEPSNAGAQFNLGTAFYRLSQFENAIEAYRRVTVLRPQEKVTWSNLGSALRAQGRIKEALECYRKCLQLAPVSEMHSNLLYALWFDPDSSTSDIVAEHAGWAGQWALPLSKEIRPHDNNRDPDRRLRLAYVSPDFRGHVIAVFMQPILKHRNRDAFEVFCYADIPKADFMTERLRSEADHWVPTTGMSDEALADRIRGDRIDVLVDLTAHMQFNRMLVFARKPAPVQVSYLAYAGTTGLPAMDYRLSDVHLDPPGIPTQGPEEVVRLPRSYWCYQPQVAMPDISPCPSIAQGRVTFACFNACSKVNPEVIGLWSRTLHEVAGSHLQLAVGGGTNPHLKQTFAGHGIDPDRVELLATIAYEQYFAFYAGADIALDPFPYNGGTTTLDALYMGVPVVSLAGTSGMSRAGVSILTNAGLPEFIAATLQDYVKIATDLAGDQPRRIRLRQTLRQRLESSALMDAPRFVRELEDAYRQMWRRYAAAQ